MNAVDLHGLRFHRLISVPRPPEDGQPDETPTQLCAALVAAHAALVAGAAPGAMIAVAWLRRPGDPHTWFLVGGYPGFPPAARGTSTAGSPERTTGEPEPVLYPPGGKAVAIETAAVVTALGAFPVWQRCTGISDALWSRPAHAPAASGRAQRRGSFDDHVAHLPGAYAWLVLATPVSPRSVEAESADLLRSIPFLQQRDRDAQARVELERSDARYRELTRAAASGMWEVRVLAGGADPVDARLTAALLCGTSDLDDLPYVLTPSPEPPEPLTVALEAQTAPRYPFRASAELLAAIARPPRRELPGITLVAPHTFDVTPEGALRHLAAAEPPNRTDDSAGGDIHLGEVLDAGWTPAGPLAVSRATLNRHAFVCGATGSGKSQTVRSLLEALSTAPDPVPWMVLEPAKAEYARMAGRLTGHDVLVIRPGRIDAAPAALNPLEPEPGFPLQSHIDLVRALFLAAFESHEPFPQVLARALTVCYSDAGWDLVASRMRPAHRPRMYDDEELRPARPRYPTLGDLQRTASRVVERIGYGTQVTADVRGFVDVRIGSLREGTPGRFFEGGHPLDIGALLTRNVVFELEDITNDQDKAFLLGAVLVRIVEHLRVRHAGGAAAGDEADRLRHLLVVEEAHRLLRNVDHGPAAAAVELFASLLAEIRAYGEGVLVVEQIPAKIVPDVLKNTALKVMHRLPSADDRAAVGATMNLQRPQSELVVALPAGVAAVTVDGMDRPVLTRMTPGSDRESAAGARHDGVPLAGRRSQLCGADCRQRACTLAEVNDAAHLAAEPDLLIWVEAVAAHQMIGLAHLLKLPAPAPSAELRTRLASLPPRSLDCALAHAVDRAVSARASALRPFVDPDDTADRLSDTLHRLSAGLPAVTGDTRQWTAGKYRWQDVRRALVRASSEPWATTRPHPDTPDWRRRGLLLVGATVVEQLRELQEHPANAAGQDAVSLGDIEVSGLLPALRQLVGGTTPHHLRAALRSACAGPGLAKLGNQIADLVERQNRST
ncbi:DNA helicase HerA, contains HAS-barrel and ATPase domains [Parafrankia irregularis]|uniref:DNA helicase HerA, contains HAS-barrel and ATPase domains n=1 Tax=Parafrankia irregularis TaxID=795642 RepID=A0A0S4QJ07_9ACTN|nr:MULTISPECIES: DUF87 domain-containing protein [Parafrankia]MBE3200831.1 ATP-binding protein [Parafrankia sp. CH37]CUU54776.1 DNA helicase HerA, contains HAS-barrel and ATPase domains [Parafrankia irregularis]